MTDEDFDCGEPDCSICAENSLRNRLDNAEGLLSSATDLLNSWAREYGIKEASTEDDIKGVIDRLWSTASNKETKRRQALMQMVDSRMTCYREENMYKRGYPGHPDNEMGM